MLTRYKRLSPEAKRKQVARNVIWRRLNPEKYKESQSTWYKSKGAEYHRRKRGLPDATRPCPEFCELCGLLPNSGKSLHLDHEHATNKFRGWLCNTCNTGLGFMKECPALLHKAADYIENNKNERYGDIGSGVSG